jgi:Tfp pilus assembly PilM family ATPase
VSRLLGIDWDHGVLRLVEATAQRGKVSAPRAFSWTEQVAPNPAQAEEAGRRLRERLREAGIAQAPVVACIGRDRVIIRDIRYPDVPAAEVPAIIRFQAAKELTFPADETVIDYSIINVPLPSGEKRALAVILRKELLAAYETMCKAAGLRLEGLTVRPFALLANWQTHAAAGGAASEFQALLVGNELCVARGSELLFARSVSGNNGDGNGDRTAAVVAELRRSLAAYAGQFPRSPVATLYVGDHALLAETAGLAAKLRVPVRGYEPAGAASLNGQADEAADFAGALGLVEAVGGRRPLGVDFVHPKQPPATGPNKKRRLAIIAAAAAVPILGVVIAYSMAVASRNADIQELSDRKAELQKQINAYADVDKRYEAIGGWADGEMVIADELYDLFAVFPDVPGIRITSVQWAALPPEPPSQNKTTATRPASARTRVAVGTLSFVASADSEDTLAKLKKALEEAREHWVLEPGGFERDTPGPRQARVTLKVLRIEPKDYHTVLEPPVNKTAGFVPGRSVGNRFRGGPGSRLPGGNP